MPSVLTVRSSGGGDGPILSVSRLNQAICRPFYAVASGVSKIRFVFLWLNRLIFLPGPSSAQSTPAPNDSDQRYDANFDKSTLPPESRTPTRLPLKSNLW